MEHIGEALYDWLQKITPIPREEWEVFKDLTVNKTMSKNSHFARAGELTEAIGICISGLFRLYYTDVEGKETNKSFCTKHDFIASYSSLLQNTPSYFSIQAMMDSELIIIRYSDFQSLYARHICWERMGRILIERLFMKKERRERELLMLSAEARYLLFLEKYGHLAKHIPQYHIASYLGITPVALSRIRGKLT